MILGGVPSIGTSAQIQGLQITILARVVSQCIKAVRGNPYHVKYGGQWLTATWHNIHNIRLGYRCLLLI